MDKILGLPFEIQAMLVAGYLAYRVSVVGIDSRIRAHDQIFQTLVFGFIGWYIGEIIQSKFGLSKLRMVGVVFVAAFAAAWLWRKLGRKFAILGHAQVKNSYC